MKNVEAASLLLVGCGQMGGAMLQRWIDAGTVSRVHIVKPSPPPEEFSNVPNISWSATLDAPGLDFNPDIVMLAVRPPLLDAVLPAYAKFKDSLYLSILAGKKLGSIEALLGLHSTPAVIRAMPNLPVMVGEGITFAFANNKVTPRQHDLVNALLNATGQAVWMDDESNFDRATALSGCGPSYVFALTEAMADAGEKLGLSEAVAMQLARQTIIGSGLFMKASTESVAEMRIEIGSPGTMTEAALKILRGKDGLNELLLKAMTAATNHAKVLAK